MWSDVFLIGDTAVVLMDMQGLYDEMSGVVNESDNLKVFALGSLISSVQIFNTNIMLQKHNFDCFKSATDFAQIIQRKPTNFNSLPFQKLIFLMRDWSNKDLDYGLKDGMKYIARSINHTNSEDYINSTYEQVSCFLMPRFDNGYDELDFEFPDSKFVNNLQTFIEWLFSPENIVKKTVFGDRKTGANLHDFINIQFKMFQEFSDKSPSEISSQIFLDHEQTAMDLYQSERDELFKSGSSIGESHAEAKSQAEEMLKSYDLKSATKYARKSLLSLQDKIESSFKAWSKAHTKKRLIYIGISISIVFLIVVSILLTMLLVKRCRVHRKRHHDLRMAEFNDTLHEIERERIEQMYSIGKGGFGEVFKAILRGNDGTPNEMVALKMMKLERDDSMSDFDYITRKSELERKFIEEARTMAKFNTYHIMKLKGYWLRDRPYLMVMEFAEHGDLKTFLLKYREVLESNESAGPSTKSPNYFNIRNAMSLEVPNNTDKNRLILRPFSQIALEIADGMAYLENIKFVHRDLAARNCMVKSDFTVKVGDFGMTRFVDSSNYYMLKSRKEIPIRWSAPETIKNEKFSSKSDVFSFGVVLWELVTLGEIPYPVSNLFRLTKTVSSFHLAAAYSCKP
jgi:hypothetical protein